MSMNNAIAVESARIDAADLKARMEASEPVTVIDVRGKEPWESSDIKVRGAIRVDPYHFRIDPSWPKDRLTVLYCT
jgi:rhodanese-related sulfurtransferase